MEIRFVKERPIKNGLYLIRRTKDTCPMLYWFIANGEILMPVERNKNPQKFKLDDFKDVEYALLGEELA